MAKLNQLFLPLGTAPDSFAVQSWAVPCPKAQAVGQGRWGQDRWLEIRSRLSGAGADTRLPTGRQVRPDLTRVKSGKKGRPTYIRKTGIKDSTNNPAIVQLNARRRAGSVSQPRNASPAAAQTATDGRLTEAKTAATMATEAI